MLRRLLKSSPVAQASSLRQIPTISRARKVTASSMVGAKLTTVVEHLWASSGNICKHRRLKA